MHPVREDSLDSERVRETVIYHWDRIIAVAGALILLVAVLGWGFHHWLIRGSVGSSPDPARISTVQTIRANEDVRIAPSADAEEGSGRAGGTSSPVVSRPALVESRISSGPGGSKPLERAVAPITSQPPAANASSLAPVAAKRHAGPRAIDEPSPEAANQARDSAGPIAPPRLSSHVTRFQLTAALKDKRPVDDLGDVVNLHGRSLIKVYLFSMLKGLKGHRIYHEWYQGRQRVGRIAIKPYLDAMRASSSKYLTPAMTGHWTVRVVDRRGRVLAWRQFRLVDH